MFHKYSYHKEMFPRKKSGQRIRDHVVQWLCVFSTGSTRPLEEESEANHENRVGL